MIDLGTKDLDDFLEEHKDCKFNTTSGVNRPNDDYVTLYAKTTDGNSIQFPQLIKYYFRKKEPDIKGLYNVNCWFSYNRYLYTIDANGNVHKLSGTEIYFPKFYINDKEYNMYAREWIRIVNGLLQGIPLRDNINLKNDASDKILPTNIRHELIDSLLNISIYWSDTLDEKINRVLTILNSMYDTKFSYNVNKIKVEGGYY